MLRASSNRQGHSNKIIYISMFRMNLSNTDLLDKSLAKISLKWAMTDCETEEEFAWIDRVPESLQFAINM